jgi:hypothetical protein
MCSFGKPLTGAGGTKFYTGNKDDTPWNRDLLWKVFVDTEAEVQKKPADKREGCIGIRRTHMGVTGTLIPESMYAVLLERQKKERQVQAARGGGGGTARSGRSTARSGRSTARSGRSTARSTGRSSAGSARVHRTSRTVRDLKTTLVGEVRRRQQAENQIDKLREEMDAMKMEISQLSKK